MSTRTPLLPVPGHDLTITVDVIRIHVDCSCEHPPQRVHPTTRSAERAALRHYLDHAAGGPDKTRAQQLLEQITTTQKENQP